MRPWESNTSRSGWLKPTVCIQKHRVGDGCGVMLISIFLYYLAINLTPSEIRPNVSGCKQSVPTSYCGCYCSAHGLRPVVSPAGLKCPSVRPGRHCPKNIKFLVTKVTTLDWTMTSDPKIGHLGHAGRTTGRETMGKAIAAAVAFGMNG